MDPFDYCFGQENFDKNISLSKQEKTKQIIGQATASMPSEKSFLSPQIHKKLFKQENILKDETFEKLCFNYLDILKVCKTEQEFEDSRQAALLHALNHVYKIRDSVLKNNEKLKTDPNLEFRDQGFTRPKVLILTPMKCSALSLAESIFKIAKLDVVNKSRFLEEFDAEADFADKPTEYQEIFTGNTDDCFRIGMKFTRKSLKLYSDFYSSDILLASPLGLRMLIEKNDFDFLSSLVVILIDQADVLLMQNFDHLVYVLDSCGKVPKESHGCDYSRVKSIYLEEKQQIFTQKIVLTRFVSPEINSLYNKKLLNLNGQAKFNITWPSILPPRKQTFTRIKASIEQAHDDRFNYFTETTLKGISESAFMHTNICIFISSYFDFVRLRNYFTEKNLSFCCLSEYTSDPDITRSRGKFFNGHVKFLLITERFMFFKRYFIKGIKHLFFYSLPEYNDIYSFMVKMTVEDGTVGSIFTKFDALKLERIASSVTAAKMITEENPSFIFT